MNKKESTFRKSAVQPYDHECHSIPVSKISSVVIIFIIRGGQQAISIQQQREKIEVVKYVCVSVCTRQMELQMD